MPKGVYERKSEEQRFWEKVVQAGEDECWLWGGAKFEDGYGCFSRNGGTSSARRFTAEKKFGDLADNLVRHVCDNRLCVNPSHLLLGTPADNSADMKERNRQAKGEKAPSAVLSDEQARQILKRYADEKAKGKLYGALERIATEFGVSKQSVYRITSRQSYKHL